MELIRKYFPALGTSSNEKRVHPEDPLDSRYFANDISDDASASPMPLLCIVWSAPESELSGKLKALHDELTTSMILVDYSAWKLEDLRKAVEGMTTSAQTAQGVKYRLPKTNLSFAQALAFIQMTISLLRRGRSGPIKPIRHRRT